MIALRVRKPEAPVAAGWIVAAPLVGAPAAAATALLVVEMLLFEYGSVLESDHFFTRRQSWIITGLGVILAACGLLGGTAIFAAGGILALAFAALRSGAPSKGFSLAGAALTAAGGACLLGLGGGARAAGLLALGLIIGALVAAALRSERRAAALFAGWILSCGLATALRATLGNAALPTAGAVAGTAVFLACLLGRAALSRARGFYFTDHFGGLVAAAPALWLVSRGIA